MHNALALSELLEAIFTFLGRKNLHRSCTRVCHQWNTVSIRVIQKKRKSEFINIPGIRDNIILHLYKNRAEFLVYCYKNKIWRNILDHLQKKDLIFRPLNHYNWFLNSSCKRKKLLRNKRQLIQYMEGCVPLYLKHDREINRYYQDILSQYDIKAEFLRLSRVCRSYIYLSSTQDEFRRMSRAFRSTIH